MLGGSIGTVRYRSGLRLAFIGLVTALILFSVAYWGGSARVDALFFLGVAVMSSILLAFCGVTWWIFLSPLPQAAQPATVFKPVVRQLVSLLALVGGLLFVIGGTWDEVWHRLYGVGGPVNDFFWPPHKMIYGSMALTAFFAFDGLFLLLRGQGNLRSRLRAEPLLTLLALSSAYLVVSAPSDQLWHIIYGLDITGWSLPHISITIGAALVLLTTAAMLLSQAPRGKWRGLGGLALVEILALLAIAAAVLPPSQAAFVEFESITRIGEGKLNPVFWQRPEWLYPVVVISVSMFFSLFALYATRRAGAATLTMVIAAALRTLLLTLGAIWNANDIVRINSFLLMILPALALDVWYWFRRSRAGEGANFVLGNFVATVWFLLIALPSISTFLVYPRVNAATLPGMIVFTLLMGSWFGWCGAKVGEWMGSLGVRPAEFRALSPRVVWIGVGALALLAALSAIYMLTAPPPVV